YSSGDLFGTLGVKIVEGRDFQPSDYNYDQVNGDPNVAVISKALAELMFPHSHALGQQITYTNGQGAATIVGIIDPFYSPYSWPIQTFVVFQPASIVGRGTPFLVRVEPGAMKSVSAEIDRRLAKSNAGRVLRMQTIAEFKDQYFSGARIVIQAMTGVIILLVFVTALGIVGITSL